MTKRFFLACLALFLFCAVSHAGEDKGKSPQFQWKAATLAPDGLGWSQHMKNLVFPEIEKSTENNLKVKVYWGGVMGDEEDYIKKIRIGQLQSAGLSAQGTVMACPDMAVTELPFLFRNYHEVDYIRIKMHETFDKIMAESGFFLIGWIDQDFDQIYSTKHPMATMKDFKQSRFITWYGPMEEEMLKALDADIVPINVPEMAASIRQGVADAAIGPAVFVVGTQLYTKIKYINPIKIRYSPATIILTLEAWNSMPESYRVEFFQKRLEIGWEYCNLVRKDNKKFVNALVQYGLKKTEMTDKNREELKKKCMEVWPEATGKYFSKQIFDEVTAHLADYRAGKRLSMRDLLVMSKYGEKTVLPPEMQARIADMVRKSMKEFGFPEDILVDLQAK